jgi:DNA-binding NtrC family response regulator
METTERFGNILGTCDAMREVYEQIKRVCTLEIPVLITGESGTGKDMVAQSIHVNSPRNTGPFMPVNMGAISPELIESELFGHEKGAFTSANKTQLGKFELGRDGTLFLDEITSMEPKVQVSLLRVLESHQFQRVGGSNFITTNTRIVSATNENIHKAVEKGVFREDLFYRLSVFPIHMPPLRERKGDILLLADNFLQRYSEEFNKKAKSFTSKAKDRLLKYSWPGNVRELENAIIKALIMTNDEEITEKYLPKRRNGKKHSLSFTIEVGASIEETEKKLIQTTLEHTGENKTKTAKMLEISRKALYNKMHYYDLVPAAAEGKKEVKEQ